MSCSLNSSFPHLVSIYIVPRRSVSVDFVSNFFAVWDLNISSIFFFLFEAVVGN